MHGEDSARLALTQILRAQAEWRVAISEKPTNWKRTKKRVDLALDRRVREAIASVVLEQTVTLAPLLRERLDAVVREVVTQAVAEELRARGGGTAQPRPREPRP